MKQSIQLDKSKTFRTKPKKVKDLIQHTLNILNHFGVPLSGTPRRLERMAISFLACGDIKSVNDFNNVKDLDSGYSLKTRDIIKYINKHFKENISPGSYDDIRRKDLRLLILADIIIPSIPDSSRNDSTRGYGVNPFYAKLIKHYGKADWNSTIKEQLNSIKPLNQKLKRERTIRKVRVKLPDGIKLELTAGEHNILQKKIIEEFLPRYGFGAELLYVGDTSDKYLYLEKERLAELNFFEISHGELPDILAYSSSKKWLYLIEAVHSSGPIDELRLLQLQKLTKDCIVEVVYVTAFLDKATFRKYTAEIAWETEVWIADNPDHLIHFNGDKFLGPYVSSQ